MACNESKPKSELLRIAAYEGEITIDESGKAKGRGMYLCPCAKCYELARKKRAIIRHLDVELEPKELDRLFEKLGEYERKN